MAGINGEGVVVAAEVVGGVGEGDMAAGQEAMMTAVVGIATMMAGTIRDGSCDLIEAVVSACSISYCRLQNNWDFLNGFQRFSGSTPDKVVVASATQWGFSTPVGETSKKMLLYMLPHFPSPT